MLGSSMLDIAIGIVFIFLLLSVFATAINEIVSSLVRMRGKMLLKGIQVLLNDTGATGLVEKLYNNGQVYGLYEGSFHPDNPRKLPSYIPAKNFSMALIDIVENLASELPGVVAVAGAAAPQTQPGATAPPAAISQAFRDGAASLAANPLTEKVGKPLVAMIAMAQNDVTKLQKSIEDWFNSGMDRVSGWYRYHTQKTLLIIGIVMAVAINANTLVIVDHLSKDQTFRQSIVAAAQNAKPPQTTSSQTTTAASDDAGAVMTAQIGAAKTALSGITELGVPLGWHGNSLSRESIGFHLTKPEGFLADLRILLGWLLTAIAISLGAPFWFDALNKIMVIRSTVKPAEKSKDEASKG